MIEIYSNLGLGNQWQWTLNHRIHQTFVQAFENLWA